MNVKEATMKFLNVIKHNVIEVKLDTRLKKNQIICLNNYILIS